VIHGWLADSQQHLPTDQVADAAAAKISKSRARSGPANCFKTMRRSEAIKIYRERTYPL
jgi:hypothetical protein